MPRDRMKIEWWDIDRVIPYQNNPRHNDDAVEKVANSLREFGWKQSLVVDSDGVLIVGHTRLKAAKSLGMDKVPVLVANDLTPAQAQAYRIADNASGGISTWDFDLLAVEVDGLQVDFDMEDFGVDLSKLDFDFEGGASKDIVEDDVPEDAPSIVQRGDVWQLGRHRLMCGDSTDPAVIDRLMDVVKAKLLLTDPPYGIKADKGVGGFGSSPKTANKYNDEWDSFTPSKETFDMILKKADNSIIFGGNYFTDKLPLGKCWIVWDKVGDIQFQNPYSDCELAWTNIERNSVKKYTKIQQGFIADEKEKRVHPTQKPVGMLADILKDFSEENDSILDVFGGSGSTLIACEQLNRKCYMMELEPHYCDIIIERWQNLTGETAHKVEQDG